MANKEKKAAKTKESRGNKATAAVSQTPATQGTTVAEGSTVPNTGTEQEQGGDFEKNNEEEEAEDEQKKPTILYKSSRLKGYLTIALASFINYDAAQISGKALSGVPSTLDQRRYAIAVSVVSMILSGAAVVVHLDRFTPLEKLWIKAFEAKSRFELALTGFLAVWWAIGTGVETCVTGMGGDAKGQYSFYFSCWVCLLTSLGLVDAWLRSADDSAGVRAFITSWPNRAPAWLCIMVLSMFTMIWYLDLWKNYSKLLREEEKFIVDYFDKVGDGLWEWLIIVTVFTFFSAMTFVLIEIFRETKVDGGNQASWETTVEGLCFFSLVLTWIPTVMFATTPGGPASLIGNAYFFTWLLVIFIFEGTVWYIHDMRQALHRALKEKEDEYKLRQKEIIEETKRIQARAKLPELPTEPSSRDLMDTVDSIRFTNS